MPPHAARVHRGRPHQIANRDLTRFRGQTSETTQLVDRKALHDALVTHFGFDLDVDALRVPMIPEWI